MTNKLRLCAAFLLHQLGKDHNTWSLSVRPGFQPIYINWSSFRFVIFFYVIGNNSTFIVVCFDYICVNIGYFSLEEALSKVPQKLHKAKRLLEEEEELEETLDNSNKRLRLLASQPMTSRTPNPAQSVYSPHTGPSSMAASPRPTPRRIAELSGKEVPEVAANLFKTPLKETRMDVSRGTPELDEGFHWGDYIGEGTVQAIHKGGEGNVIVYELTEIGKGGLRATISDNRDFSVNVIFNDNVARAKEELQGKISVIALCAENLEIHNGCVVLVSDWHWLGEGPPPRELGHTKVLPESFFRSLRKGNGSLTPSGMKRKKW